MLLSKHFIISLDIVLYYSEISGIFMNKSVEHFLMFTMKCVNGDIACFIHLFVWKSVYVGMMWCVKIVWHNKWTAPNIGCSEKLKNAKCDNSYSYSMAPWYIKKRENLIFLNFDRIIGFMVFESTGSIMVSMQKTVLKNMHRVLRYWQKCVKCYWFGLEGRFWTYFC